MSRAKAVGRRRRKIRGADAESRKDMETQVEVDPPIPYCQEKLLNVDHKVTVP